MKIAAFGYLLFFFAPMSASAQTSSEYDSMYEKCIEKEVVINNSVVEICSDMISEKAKREITKHYKSIYDRLLSENPEDAKKFEISQKAWLQYRNAHCNLAGSYIGSPMYVVCPMKLNSARVLELRELDGVR
jgi:uncharacterized protein YecT (DUF1311 family)